MLNRRDLAATRGLTTSDNIALGIGTTALGAMASSAMFALRRHYRPGSGQRDDLADWYRTLELPTGENADENDGPGQNNADRNDDPWPAFAEAGQAVSRTNSLTHAARPHSAHGIPSSASTETPDAKATAAPRPRLLADTQAARAALVDALTRPTPVDVILAGADLRHLASGLGANASQSIHVTGTLEQGLDDLEALITYRARTTAAPDTDAPLRPVLLLAHRPADQRRLHALLELGAQFAVTAALLPPHSTATPTVPVATRTTHVAIPAPPAGSDHAQADLPHTGPAAVAKQIIAGSARTAEPLVGTEQAAHAAAAVEPDTAATHSQASPGYANAAFRLRVLGPVRLTHTPSTAASRAAAETRIDLGPKKRELLAFLALHPDGVARDELINALWPDAPIDRPRNALHATLTRLRADLTSTAGPDATRLVTHDNGQYRLNPALVDIDLTHVNPQRTEAAQIGDREQKSRHLLRAYDELAADIPAAWIVLPRENLRRDALDAAITLARHASATDPQAALDLLERARDIDPYNEQIYRGIMRLQRRLGRISSIPRTLAVLRAQLGEIDSTPDATTLDLAEELEHVTKTMPGGQAPAS